MEVQDYNYYAAHATDVKLQGITSDEYNADIIARLRDDDPELKYFAIAAELDDIGDFIVREGDHLGWVGYFVGRSEKLDSLFIDNFQGNFDLNAFFEGLGHNRSIQNLHISKDLGDSFKSLIPFLRNNDSLHDIYFDFFDIGLECAHNIAMLLSQQSSITRLHFEEIGFDDGGFSQIITTALSSQPQMGELHLNGNSVGRNGYVALGKALQGCFSLRKLELRAYDNDNEDEGFIDDKGLHALAEGLKNCHNLTSLNLYGKLMITEAGSRCLSTLFQSDNCQLEHLDLGRMNIDDGDAAVLASGLASLSSLKRLKLQGMSIGGQGLQHLARGLINCNLEELDLSRNIHSVGDQGLQDLVRGLVNCNIEKLVLSNNMLMNSVSGLRVLGTLVARRGTNIYRLSLIESSLTDEGLQSFVQGMANCCSLTELNLSHNRSITGNGLASLSSLLRAEHCSLRTLVLYGINLGDDGAAVLANGLVGNKSLTSLIFGVSGITITERGWEAFSGLLCDTSSVNNTYLSNHTLVHIGGFQMSDTPQDIVEYLKWNKLQNQAAAICKILHSHPDIDVTPLFQFNLGGLPLVVAWLEKAKSYRYKVNESPKVFKNRQLSAVYKFIRGMPLLAANGFRSHEVKDVRLQLELKSKKRKLDQTL